jgi:hypothetical protein
MKNDFEIHFQFQTVLLVRDGDHQLVRHGSSIKPAVEDTYGPPNATGSIQELITDLSDALDILYSCRRLAVPVSDSFLTCIDTLIDRIEAGRPYTLPAA